MRQESKILFLFVYLFLTLSSFGIASPDREGEYSVVEKSNMSDLDYTSESLFIIKKQSHNPYSSFPFSDQLSIELEPDEEDISKKDFRCYIPVNRDSLLYHTEAPPIQGESYSRSEVYHTPIFILFEVFRL